MVSRPARQKYGGQALQSATKTADKNNGGQALDLLIALVVSFIGHKGRPGKEEIHRQGKK